MPTNPKPADRHPLPFTPAPPPPRGCSCCDPTADSPDPVAVRLEREVELLKGLLREAVEVAHYDDEWCGNDIPDTWFWRVVAAIEGKP